MKITGIIAEYNPFHNGHLYHLTQAREKTGADYVIVVMSGDFTQRGYPAITDKHLRTQMALSAGADLVLELPVCYATGSAEYFAKGAVSLLDGLGVVDTLCFGSEQGSLTSLTTIAKGLLAKDSADTMSQLIGKYVREGHSYPKARSLSYAQIFPSLTSLQSVLSSPNNLLGIEYIKALLACGSQIQPVTIKRNGADYHDEALSLSANSSASAIRSTIHRSNSIDGLSDHMPKKMIDLLSEGFHKKLPIYADDFSLLLHYKLIREMQGEFSQYMDVSKELSDKIRNNIDKFNSFTFFCSYIKSKDLTHTRISRSLLHILLDLKKSDYHPELPKAPIHYARILGFQEHATPLLHEIKTRGSIPLLSKLSAANTLLSNEGINMLQKDIDAAHLYEAVASAKFHTPFVHEYKKQIIVLPSQY